VLSRRVIDIVGSLLSEDVVIKREGVLLLGKLMPIYSNAMLNSNANLPVNYSGLSVESIE
jgi:hypothetical protein